MKEQSQNKTSSNFLNTENGKIKSNAIEVPSISLPKGGGAIKGIEEKFQVNAVNGTASFSIPLPFSASRKGISPTLSVSYNSGAGNGTFGLGWEVGIPSVSRKTEKELPRYRDENESDTFILAGAEDLVPTLIKQGDEWIRKVEERLLDGHSYTVYYYRPRIETGFLRIERWRHNQTHDTFWKTVSGDNIHSYYGYTTESRISDPENPLHVFSWLLSHTHDDQGSITRYLYKQEDLAGIPAKAHEKNKKATAQQYLKKVLYGVRTPFYLGDPLPDESQFLFNGVFDYGEHHDSEPLLSDVDQEKEDWQVRKDAFSTFRSGFEIRTYRRCRRFLMFHCFDEEDLPLNPYLVSSTRFFYQEELELSGMESTIESYSFLKNVRQSGHKWDETEGHYSTKHFPDFLLHYQPHAWNTEVQRVSEEEIVHAPIGIKDSQYLWVDLFSEGLSGILTEQADGWFYKSNLGDGRFSHAKPIGSRPSFNGLASHKTVLQDLHGNGQKSLVHYDDPKGYFKMNEEDKWEPFKTFPNFPNIDLSSPNLRGLDLTGDGKMDLLLSEENQFRWYASKGEEGFAVSESTARAIDEEKGPAIVFADREQCIFLADMSGDGLTDIIRIRNGEVCYWPNMGYAVFGPKVTMDNAPWFDYKEAYQPSLLRLADIDGSGTTDLIYLGQNKFSVWMNQNGNSWTLQQTIDPFPKVSQLTDVHVIDFLGTGTACIVHSSSAPTEDNRSVRYIDLMDSKKPHLLTGYENNCGAETNITYKPSTHFYLEDQKEGRPWITKLPFPVHCVWKSTSIDHIAETRFTSSYRYSHGYYDPYEREYRGFARVEQIDTETFDHFKLNEAKNVVEEALHQPPVRTVSWFHNGSYLKEKSFLEQIGKEFFVNEAFAEKGLSGVSIDDELTGDDLQEAFRTCKNVSIRTEIYSDEDNSKAHIPYGTSENGYVVRQVQPKGGNKYASFQLLPKESLTYGYDRNPSDPRISHNFTIDSDSLGNPLKTVALIYPRITRPTGEQAIPDEVWDKQNRLYIAYNEFDYTNDITTDNIYRLRAGCENRSFEVNGITQPVSFYLEKEELATLLSSASTLTFDEEFTSGPEKRLNFHNRVYFNSSDLTSFLPLGELSDLAIVRKTAQLAFTKGLIQKHYTGKVDDTMMGTAGYVHSEGDDDWWVPSGEVLYPANPEDHFYIPIGNKDLFGNENEVTYDKYLLSTISTRNALGHEVSVMIDYRTLVPSLVTDINGNRSEVEMDELSIPIRTAIMGKSGSSEGDTLSDPTTWVEYDLFQWQVHQKPNFVHSLSREVHGPANTRWQESYSYSDGSGSTIMKKAQAKPGKAKRWNNTLKEVEEVDADPRWVGNGRTILNNKGMPIKSFDPYFSTTHEYENEAQLVETGFSSTTYYDPIGRVIKVENPDGTHSNAEFDPWYFKTFDLNDTVLDSSWYADRGSPAPTDLEPASLSIRSAWLAAKHANTPTTVHLDALARPTYSISDLGGGHTFYSHSEVSPGNRSALAFDQKDRLVSEAFTNLLGTPVFGETAEKGKNWTLLDAMGRIVKIWDNDIREYSVAYDVLHRPVSTYMLEGGAETLVNHVVYGDMLPDASDRNMKGAAYMVFDQSGQTTTKTIDFKDNILDLERRLCKDYKSLIDWKALENLTDEGSILSAAEPFLESEVFSTSATLDALNRPLTSILPDHTEIVSTYNQSNQLENLQVKIRGEGDFISFLKEQDYNAKGERQFAHYGNDLITEYFYNPFTFRLNQLITKPIGDPDSNALQNLIYEYDPVGNITSIIDDAQQTHYFNNAVVKPQQLFEYDALYRLVTAKGRELSGGLGNPQRTHNNLPPIQSIPHINDALAVRNYTETYAYDDLGNITQMKHMATDANWTRRYRYAYENDPTNNTNRLLSTSKSGDPIDGPYTDTYQYDLKGNMTRMPHLDELKWNFMDQLQEVDLGGGGKAFYVYGIGGNRSRKIIERNGGKRLERIYLGPVEVYREYQGTSKRLERNTVHIGDDAGRIAQVDTKLLDLDGSDTNNLLDQPVIRYQFSNHLGSATVETNENGEIISYEEYHPYGTSAYRSKKSGTDLSLKRYRFSGKEKDDETGLYYFGARYYASWLGRWTSCDPAGFIDGLNLYRYVRNNPINLVDPNGTDPNDPSEVPARDVTTQRASAEVRAAIHQNTPEARAILDQAFPVGTIVEGTQGTYQIVGGSRWVGETNLLTWRPYTPGEGSSEEGDSGGTDDVIEVEATPAAPAADPAPAEDSNTPAGEGAITHLGPAAERVIWHHEWGRFNPRWRGLNGASQRGFILQNLYTNNPNVMQRDNIPDFDQETPTRVKQIKSTSQTSTKGVRSMSSGSTRAATRAVNTTPSMAGKSPQAVIITPTDAPASVGTEIQEGFNRIRNRHPSAVAPEHVRGVPGRAGMATRGLTVIGTGMSAYSLYNDIQTGDVPMGIGDSLGVIGGGLEIYGILAPGATVAGGVTAMSAGLIIGGIGISVTSGVSMVRAIEQGDTAGAIAGGVGVGAGVAITAGAGILAASAAGIAVGAGAVAAAPVILAVGIVAAVGVGIFHAGRHFDWW